MSTHRGETQRKLAELLDRDLASKPRALRDFDKKIAAQLHRNVLKGFNAYDTCLLLARLHLAADEIDYLRKVLWDSVPESMEVDFMRHLIEEVERLREGT